MSGFRVASLMVIAVLMPGHPRAVELMAPSTDVALQEDHLVLVGRSDSAFVLVSLDGAPAHSVPVENEFFHAMLELNVGLHEVSVSDGQAGQTATLNILSGPRIDRSYATSFQEYRFHGSVPRQECSTCHPPAESGSDVASLTGWCVNCHPDVRTKFTRHAGDDPVTCSSCHLVNQDLTLSRPATHADANPCYGCHTDKIGEFAQAFVHGPVAGGACTICHDPHGSDFDHTLNQPAVLLCLSCHRDLDPDAYAVEHQPFVNGQCVDCHDPHATRNRWVLQRSSEELCFPCHGAGGELDSHVHPYNVKPRQRLDADLPLTPGGRLECLSCHEAHGGSRQSLLRSPTDNVCVGCHPRH